MIEDIFIPIEKWGKDHWSTLLYIETLVVDKRGQIEMMADPHMRSVHPDYPTRLADGSTIEMHDDWDCLQDMFVAGLVEWVDDDGERLGFTDKGWELAAKERRRRGELRNKDSPK